MTLTEKETQVLIKELKAKAANPTLDETDVDLYDASGGQYDDSYGLGLEDGEIYLARDILRNYFGIEV